MFKGLQRLQQNQYRFTLSDKTRRNIREAISDNCNVFDFMDDSSAVVFDKGYSVTCTDLYAVYEYWCRENALTALRQDSFVIILRANEKRYSIAYDFNVLNEHGKRVRGFKGIKTVYRIRARIRASIGV